jgi:hypothetical protein
VRLLKDFVILKTTSTGASVYGATIVDATNNRGIVSVLFADEEAAAPFRKGCKITIKGKAVYEGKVHNAFSNSTICNFIMFRRSALHLLLSNGHREQGLRHQAPSSHQRHKLSEEAAYRIDVDRVDTLVV